MKELIELLNKLTDNTDVKDPYDIIDTDSDDGDEMFHGIPGQFGSQRSFRPQRKRIQIQRAPSEYERYLDGILDKVPALLEAQNLVSAQSKKLIELLQASREELAIIQAKPLPPSKKENIILKFTAIENVMTQLGGFEVKEHALDKKNLTDLTQLQIVILFNYLRKNRLVGAEMTDTAFAANLSEITGFSKEKLRQAFSKIKDPDNNIDANFRESDYIKVRNTLRSILEQLDKDLEEKF